MINKATVNKLYIASTSLLCVLIYLLNYCVAIYQCALIFTMIAITVNVTTASAGRFKCLIGLGLAIITSFALLRQLPYYIEGRIINGLVFASFSSLMISLYFATSTFVQFRSRSSFVVSNILSLIIAAIADGMLMSLFFAINNNFTYSRILDIWGKELSYKLFYGFLASVIIFTALKISKTADNHNYNLN